MVEKISVQIGADEIQFETGRIAKQAHGAVICKSGDTMVLSAVTVAPEAREDADFFPMTVDYREKFYSVGQIPGNFFRRESRPSEREILVCRMTDRPLRPLFPKGFRNEVQVLCTVLSTCKTSDPDIAAMIGTSAALAVSGIPFDGPIGAARVGFMADKGYVLNPNYAQLDTSALNMVVAGTADAVLMVESEAQQLPEDVMLGAVVFGHEQMQKVISVIDEMVELDAGDPDDLAARYVELRSALPGLQVVGGCCGTDHRHVAAIAAAWTAAPA